MPCALNAANEEAANAFLRGEVKFLDIAGIVERVMRDHRADEATLDTVMSVDNDARQQARALIQAIPA
jgi:1-deoxy-D-xylulose-5-phosphate reductoisomerase